MNRSRSRDVPVVKPAVVHHLVFFTAKMLRPYACVFGPCDTLYKSRRALSLTLSSRLTTKLASKRNRPLDAVARLCLRLVYA